MRIVKIEKLENGAHVNQSWVAGELIPEGYAGLMDGIYTPNFPFGDIDIEYINGEPYVKEWHPLPLPSEEVTE